MKCQGQSRAIDKSGDSGGGEEMGNRPGCRGRYQLRGRESQRTPHRQGHQAGVAWSDGQELRDCQGHT